MLIVLACFGLMTCSFVLSSSEIAIFSLSRVQLKKLKQSSEPLFRRIRTLLQDSVGLLITILFFNEIVNITLASIVTSTWIEDLSAPLFWSELNLPAWTFQTVMGVLILTPILMIFCELTPKVVASKANHLIASIFIPLVYPLYQLMRPLSQIIKQFLPIQSHKEETQVQEDDFLTLAEEHTETGQLHESELELIKNVFELDDTSVDSLATPIRKVISIPESFNLEQAAQIVLKEKVFSRIPIHGSNRDHIVGILNSKDLIELRVNPNSRFDSVMSIAKEPLIVSSTSNLDILFRKMKSKKVQVAFIKNSQDRITGMVTIQDILERLIEEAFEE